MPLGQSDLTQLWACVDLAREALLAGDDPFGSILVGADGEVVHADRNRVGGGDQTRHPELAIVTRAGQHLSLEERRTATVHTSGEHCAMCSAAHAWVELGRIVYAVSATQLSGWLAEWGAAPSRVAVLPITTVAPGVRVDGPAPEIEETMRDLHRRRFEASHTR